MPAAVRLPPYRVMPRFALLLGLLTAVALPPTLFAMPTVAEPPSSGQEGSSVPSDLSKGSLRKSVPLSKKAQEEPDEEQVRTY